MLRRLLAGTALVFVASAAQATSDAATRFGVREDVQQISLSPDGKHIAFIEPMAGAGSALVIASIDTGSMTPILTSTGYPDKLRSCHWASATRLTCNLYIILGDATQRLGFSRVVAIDADGKNMKMLSGGTSDRAVDVAQRGGEVIDWQSGRDDGSVLMTHTYVPEQGTGTLLANDREGFGVDRIDTLTLKRTNVETPRKDAVGYITDGHGVVRILASRGTDSAGYDKNIVHYFYRTKGSRQWLPLGSSEGFVPAAVDSDHDVAYGFDTVDGRAALFSIALDGSGKREKLLARDDVDVGDLIQMGRQHRVVGRSEEHTSELLSLV